MANLQVLLGKRIRELRAEQGFSQESFADYCGLHRTYMGGVERGEHSVTLKSMEAIAKGLGMPLSELIASVEKAAAERPRRRRKA